MLAVMLAAPSHVAASAMGGHSRSTASPWQHSARCLRFTSLPRPRSIRRISCRNGCRPSCMAGPSVPATTQLEVPDQVNAMIEGFLRHHVEAGKAGARRAGDRGEPDRCSCRSHEHRSGADAQ